MGSGRARPGCWWAAAGPGRAPVDVPRTSSAASAAGVEGTGGTGGPGCGAGGRRRGLAELFTATYPHWCEGHRRDRWAWLRCPWAAGPGRVIHSDLAPLVRRAPEGPEGTGGLRGAAPNEVRPPSLAGGRGLRRPEHPWGHKQPTRQPKQRKRAAARQGRRAVTQLVHTLDAVESWGHSTQSRGRAFSTVAQPRPRRPGPR